MLICTAVVSCHYLWTECRCAHSCLATTGSPARVDKLIFYFIFALSGRHESEWFGTIIMVFCLLRLLIANLSTGGNCLRTFIMNIWPQHRMVVLPFLSLNFCMNTFLPQIVLEAYSKGITSHDVENPDVRGD